MLNFGETSTNRSTKSIIIGNGQTQDAYYNHDSIFIEENSQNQTCQLNSINKIFESEMDEFSKNIEKIRPEKIIIKRSNFKRELSKRTIKDHEKIEFRRNLCNDIYEKVKQLLQYISGKWQIGQLRIAAKELASKANVTIDRLANRYNECLICWFCENWCSIAPYLVNYTLEQLNTCSENNSKLLNALNLINDISDTKKMNLGNQNTYLENHGNTNLSNDESFNIKTDENLQIIKNEYQNEITNTTKNENNERTCNDCTEIHSNLNDQFQTNPTDEFFSKIFDSNFEFYYTLDDEFPGLYKEFY